VLQVRSVPGLVACALSTVAFRYAVIFHKLVSGTEPSHRQTESCRNKHNGDTPYGAPQRFRRRKPLNEPRPRTRNLKTILVGRITTYVRFEVFTAVTMNNAVLWDEMPRDSCKNRRFGRGIASVILLLILVCLRSVFLLQVIDNVVPSSPILVTMMIEAIHFSETSVLTRATQRNIPGDGILQDNYMFGVYG
jgi:hypothetical protein